MPTVNINDGEAAHPQRHTVLDVAAASLLHTIELDVEPRSIAFSADGQRAFVTAPRSHQVYVIDVPTRSVLSSFRTGSAPHGLEELAPLLLRARLESEILPQQASVSVSCAASACAREPAGLFTSEVSAETGAHYQRALNCVEYPA